MNHKILLTVAGVIMAGAVVAALQMPGYITNKTEVAVQGQAEDQSLATSSSLQALEDEQATSEVVNEEVKVVTTQSNKPETKTESTTVADKAKEEPVSDVALAPVGYTLADVASHGSEASCWTAINGSVYDVSAFIKKHPGGDRNILRICGMDGTAAFERQHGGKKGPESTLESFKIGNLR